MNSKEAKDFEKDFKHGAGMIYTPYKWIEFFWEKHRKMVIKQLEVDIQNSKSILFVGVGDGDILQYMDMKEKYIVGIDINSEFMQGGIKYCSHAAVADCSLLPFKDKTFDLVICNMVLHHVVGQGDLDGTFRDSARVLKNGGKFVAFEPNLFHPSGAIMTLLNQFHLYHKVGGGSNYEYALSPYKMKRMCRKYFESVKTIPITFSHPRFPIFLQKIIMKSDKFLNIFSPVCFSFTLDCKKD